MRRNLRTEILDTARTMFGEVGFNSVSMRNIADTLGISVGNLTYHYKKKEDLIEAVFMEAHAHYKQFQAPETLAELHEMFLRSILEQQENAYYFRHYAQMAQICPNVYEIQLQAKKNKSEAYIKGFIQFQKDGYCRSEEIKCLYRSLAYALTMMNIYWMPDEQDQIPAIHSMWNLVYPNLTQKGVSVFKDTIEPKLWRDEGAKTP